MESISRFDSTLGLRERSVMFEGRAMRQPRAEGQFAAWCGDLMLLNESKEHDAGRIYGADLRKSFLVKPPLPCWEASFDRDGI